MSAHLAGKVWFLELPRSEQLVLLALADHAHDDGSHVYPSVGYTAWKTGYDYRTVQRNIRSLEAKGVLVLVAEADRRRAREYRIDLRQAKAKPPYEPGERKRKEKRSDRADESDAAGRQSDAPAPGGASSSAARGGSGGVLGAAPVPHETSVGNVKEEQSVGAREQALSHPDLDEVLEVLEKCPRFDVARPGVRVGVENALEAHPDASPIEAARTAVVWASDPDWRKTSPAATLLDALAHQQASRSKAAARGQAAQPRSRTEEQDANVVGLLERAAELRAVGK